MFFNIPCVALNPFRIQQDSIFIYLSIYLSIYLLAWKRMTFVIISTAIYNIVNKLHVLNTLYLSELVSLKLFWLHAGTHSHTHRHIYVCVCMITIYLQSYNEKNQLFYTTDIDFFNIIFFLIDAFNLDLFYWLYRSNIIRWNFQIKI